MNETDWKEYIKQFNLRNQVIQERLARIEANLKPWEYIKKVQLGKK